jgi:hypothetical protein
MIEFWRKGLVDMTEKLVAAGVFFIAGGGCAITAVKIYLAQRRLEKMSSDDSANHRTNVRVHREEFFDL